MLLSFSSSNITAKWKMIMFYWIPFFSNWILIFPFYIYFLEFAVSFSLVAKWKMELFCIWISFFYYKRTITRWWNWNYYFKANCVSFFFCSNTADIIAIFLLFLAVYGTNSQRAILFIVNSDYCFVIKINYEAYTYLSVINHGSMHILHRNCIETENITLINVIQIQFHNFAIFNYSSNPINRVIVIAREVDKQFYCCVDTHK